MTNDEVRELMRASMARLMSVYPFPAGSAVDSRLAYAIGLAVGVLSEGLAAEREGRVMRVNLAAQPDPDPSV